MAWFVHSVIPLHAFSYPLLLLLTAAAAILAIFLKQSFRKVQATPLPEENASHNRLLSPDGPWNNKEKQEPAVPSVQVMPAPTLVEPEKEDFTYVRQPYDAYLVLDVEATCLEGTTFDWPNEIIEWPVCLLKWQDRDEKGRANKLVVVDEFRSFVRPTWRPVLSQFCTNLTGITQDEVEQAPKFANVLTSFSDFMVKNGLIDEAGRRLVRFVWCTDGPFDIRDFVVKQCFISQMRMPDWLKGDVLDVRKAVGMLVAVQYLEKSGQTAAKIGIFPRRLSLNISQQLRALNLSPFEGRQHSGIDDSRNIARILIEIARRGVRLEPNTIIQGRRWPWMGKPGQVLEQFCYL